MQKYLKYLLIVIFIFMSHIVCIDISLAEPVIDVDELIALPEVDENDVIDDCTLDPIMNEDNFCQLIRLNCDEINLGASFDLTRSLNALFQQVRQLKINCNESNFLTINLLPEEEIYLKFVRLNNCTSYALKLKKGNIRLDHIYLDGKSPLYIDVPDDLSKVNLAGTIFNIPENQIFMIIKNVPYLDLYYSYFYFNKDSSVKLLPPDNKQVTMFHANNFSITGGDGEFALDQIFSAEEGSSMSKLEVPQVEYIKSDDDHFYIEIKNEFQENGADSFWGAIDDKCPDAYQYKARSSEDALLGNIPPEKHINFDIYKLKYNGEKLISASVVNISDYSVYEEDGKKFLKAKKDNFSPESEIQNKMSMVRFGGSGDLPFRRKIAVLAHCEGNSTTNFSNIIELDSCGADEIYIESECREKCVDINECGGNGTCYNNACFLCDSGKTFDISTKTCMDIGVSPPEPPQGASGGGCSLNKF